ncbi:alpha/beta fold hydrolase [Actinosynnema sp. NPDC050436]|uniref:thioesterase II family protein n=1 Tax=Actinosynnema sp. NPDC050436 TaxID=3155659 RepID=UPI0033F386D9
MTSPFRTASPGRTARYATCYRVYRPQRAARLRLVCFPHAGGSPSFYRRWVQHLPDWVELAIALYPGREDRFGDEQFDRLDLLADELADALVPAMDRPTALLGHSMGAAVAYEVARRVENRGKDLTRLIVSAHPGPHRQRPNRVHLRDDDGLIADVVAQDAASAARFEDAALRELVLPTIRADYRLIETYRPDAPARVRAPITAVINDDDVEVDADEARGWGDCTGAGFEFRQMPGGHFHLVEHEEEFVRWLLTQVRVDPPSWPSTP